VGHLVMHSEISNACTILVVETQGWNADVRWNSIKSYLLKKQNLNYVVE
jgi:hypothetical protein